jgi:hypothetical protein
MDNSENCQRRAAEQILEDASLTADLVDDAAQSLLDWGVAQANAITERAEELTQDELDAYLANLRRTMKRINRQAGQAEPKAQTEQVQALLAEVKSKQDTEVENAT